MFVYRAERVCALRNARELKISATKPSIDWKATRDFALRCVSLVRSNCSKSAAIRLALAVVEWIKLDPLFVLHCVDDAQLEDSDLGFCVFVPWKFHFYTVCCAAKCLFLNFVFWMFLFSIRIQRRKLLVCEQFSICLLNHKNHCIVKRNCTGRWMSGRQMVANQSGNWFCLEKATRLLGVDEGGNGYRLKQRYLLRGLPIHLFCWPASGCSMGNFALSNVFVCRACYIFRFQLFL